jgi:hypothetical protein
MHRRFIITALILVGAALALAACAGQTGPAGPAGPQGAAGPQGPAGPAGAAPAAADLSCTQCHNDTTLIDGKHTAWAESVHGTGEAYVRGTEASCAGCHSGGGFSAMVAAGLTPDTVENGDPNPTRQDCRTCHEIHTTYTDADWALATTDPVDLLAVDGATFDGGEGNLCANCHQPRRAFPAPDDNGMITGISSHWGPHHGPQSGMFLAVAGAGVTDGKVSPHYSAVKDTCVGCHLGSDASHTFEPVVETCQQCHPDATDFDIDGVQTEIQQMGDELGGKLLALGLISENSADGHPVVTEAPENQAIALYNWIYVMHEDKSMGVHNPSYAKALLQAGLDALSQ